MQIFGLGGQVYQELVTHFLGRDLTLVLLMEMVPYFLDHGVGAFGQKTPDQILQLG